MLLRRRQELILRRCEVSISRVRFAIPQMLLTRIIWYSKRSSGQAVSFLAKIVSSARKIFQQAPMLCCFLWSPGKNGMLQNMLQIGFSGVLPLPPCRRLDTFLWSDWTRSRVPAHSRSKALTSHILVDNEARLEWTIWKRLPQAQLAKLNEETVHNNPRVLPNMFTWAGATCGRTRGSLYNVVEAVPQPLPLPSHTTPSFSLIKTLALLH